MATNEATIGALTQAVTLALADKIELEQGVTPSNSSKYGELGQVYDLFNADKGTVGTLSVVSGTATANLSNGRRSFFKMTIGDNFTLALSNVPAGASFLCIQFTTNSIGGYSATLPASFHAMAGSGVLVITTPSTVCYLRAYTVDGGVNWYYIIDAGGAGGGGGGGGGNVTYVAQAEVTGSAATTLDVSGLNLATDQEYIVVIDVKNAAGSTSQISLYYNDDTTDANYRRAFQSNTGTAAESNARIGGFASGETGYYECRIRSNINGRVSLFYNCYRETTTPVINNVTQATYWATVANLTKLTLSSSVASGLAIGTKITVYKRSH